MLKKYSIVIIMLFLTSCSYVSNVCMDVPDLEVEQTQANKWAFHGMNIGLKFNQECVSQEEKTLEVTPQVAETVVNDEVLNALQDKYEKKINDLENELDQLQEDKSSQEVEQNIVIPEQNEEILNEFINETKQEIKDYQLPELDELDRELVANETSPGIPVEIEENITWSEN